MTDQNSEPWALGARRSAFVGAKRAAIGSVVFFSVFLYWARTQDHPLHGTAEEIGFRMVTMAIAVTLWGGVVGLFSYRTPENLGRSTRMFWPWASPVFGGLAAGLATLLGSAGDPNTAAGVTVFTLVGGFFGWIAKFIADDARRAKAAVDQKSPDAQFKTGYSYYNGIGVRQDFGEAMRWFHKAAERGDADAQFNLGLMYGKGQGVSARDMIAAYTWILIAHSSGAKNVLLNEMLEGFNKDLSPDQVAEAKRRASEFKPKQ